MSLNIRIRWIAVALLMAGAAMAATAAETASPQQQPTFNTLADWGYILRGALFIFASAMAMVWIGRKLSKRQK